jgi:hypothetical protein
MKNKGRRETFGSGTTSGDRRVVSVAELTLSEAREVFGQVEKSTSWTATSRDVETWLRRHFAKTLKCPRDGAGQRRDLCCGAKTAGPDATCAGGLWREREDFEWYVRQIWVLWSQVNRMVTAGNAGLAAHYGVELGELIGEYNFKFGFERDALVGQKMRQNRPAPRYPPETLIAAFRKYCPDGKRKMRAYELAATELSVSSNTVQNAVRNARKDSQHA